MFSLADLPQMLPIFPLSGALLLPRARLPLHIFEPRYLTMLDDVLRSEHRLIGVIQPECDDDDADLFPIGCAGRVTAFTETPENTYLITLTGVSRFTLSTIEDGFQAYMRAHVKWDDFPIDLSGAEKDEALDRTAFLSLLARYFEAADLEFDWESLKDADSELLINAIAALSPFGGEDKQALLESPTLAQRREILGTLMEFAIRAGSRKDRLQ